MSARRILAATVAVVALSLVSTAAVASPPREVGDASTTAYATIGADQAWAMGYTGAGVGIALVDTGVSPHPLLGDTYQRQVAISGPGRVTDGHGHGTFLAGLMVGQQGPDGGPLGVAPGAQVWSVKVADAEGRTTLEEVLAGLYLVAEHADELGIRVVVLALGGPADDVPDPIERALEQLWAQGLLVVVAAGNDAGMVTEPGVAPRLLTVGAIDDLGTAELTDDTTVDWSGTGPGRDGLAKPDLLAPGKSLVSVRVPGSSADRDHPTSRIGSSWFRGSGTSMAAAVAAAGAALLLEAEPDLTPDEVKGRLVASAHSGEVGVAGTLDIAAALTSDASAANQHLDPVAPFDWDIEGEAPAWTGKSWIGKSWIGKSWIGKSWIGKSWIDGGWDGKSWIGKSWIGSEWSQDHWIGRSWTGAF